MISYSAALEGLSGSLAVFNILSCATFVVLFSRDPWRNTAFGRSVMLLAVVMMWFSIQGILQEALGDDFVARSELRLLGRLGIAVGTVSWVVTLWSQQRGGRHRDDD